MKGSLGVNIFFQILLVDPCVEKPDRLATTVRTR